MNGRADVATRIVASALRNSTEKLNLSSISRFEKASRMGAVGSFVARALSQPIVTNIFLPLIAKKCNDMLGLVPLAQFSCGNQVCA